MRLSLSADYWKCNRYRIGVVTLLLLWCLSLITARVYYTKSITYLFLYWNLALALVPLITSTLLTHVKFLRRLHILLFIIWFIFFPNAPYVLTDLVHLKHKPPVPEWFDLGLLLSFAGTSLFIGYLSLLDIHAWINGRTGRRWGWSLVIVTLFLSSFGIYLGRFLRWNSWDVLLSPGRLMSDMLFALSNYSEITRAIGVTMLFGMMLTLGYLAVHVISAQNKNNC